MMVRVLALAALLLPAACNNMARDVIVDRMNVDDAKYERDLKACRDGAGLVAVSNPVATCMTGKGYRVLMGR